MLTGGLSMAAEEIKADVGFGYVDEDFHSNSGGTGFNPRGFFVTAGWLAPSGMMIRLDSTFSQAQTGGIANFGPGLEPVQDESDFRRVAISVGFMFNRRGLVRPIVHGGVARLRLTDKFTGAFSGISETIIDSNDTVLNLGAGVEIGQDHHNLLLDVTFDPSYRVPSPFFGGDVEFDLTEAHVAYIYRF